jgi:glycerol-3-phosphate acyltransferase PlsY
MVGHSFPVFLRFRGGKAVACFVGAFLYIAPLAVLAAAVVFVLIVSLSKYISLGSILSALLFPLIFGWMMHPPQPLLLAAVFGALLVTWRHKANIRRLLAGNENKFSLKGPRK